MILFIHYFQKKKKTELYRDGEQISDGHTSGVGRGEVGCGYKEGDMRKSCRNGTILYPGHGRGYLNTHVR